MSGVCMRLLLGCCLVLTACGATAPPTASLDLRIPSEKAPDSEDSDPGPIQAPMTEPPPPSCVGEEIEPGPTPRLTCCHPGGDVLKEALRKRLPALRRCYSGQGRLTMRLHAAPSGEVYRSCAVASDLPHKATICVLEAMQGTMLVPMPEGECPRMSVVYPVVFKGME